MHLKREQPITSLPSTRLNHKWAARDVRDPSGQQKESKNAQFELDGSNGAVGNKASWARPRTIERHRHDKTQPRDRSRSLNEVVSGQVRHRTGKELAG